MTSVAQPALEHFAHSRRRRDAGRTIGGRSRRGVTRAASADPSFPDVLHHMIREKMPRQ